MLASLQHPRLEQQHRRDRADGLHPARAAARRRHRQGLRRRARRRDRGWPSGALMDRELLLEIGCEETAGQLAARPDRSDRRGRRRRSCASSGWRRRRRPKPTARRGGSPSASRGWPSVRPTSRSWSTVRPCRPASGRTARRRPPPPALPRRTASRWRRSSAIETPKGVYLAFRKKQRGKAAVDVLPDVLGGTLRGLTFPEADALGRDARGRHGRAALRPADPLAAVHLRRPRRAVHDRADAGGAERAGAGRRVRAPSPTATGS